MFFFNLQLVFFMKKHIQNLFSYIKKIIQPVTK
jgi:hypothetical protein